jgi:type II secretion system protein C
MLPQTIISQFQKAKTLFNPQRFDAMERYLNKVLLTAGGGYLLAVVASVGTMSYLMDSFYFVKGKVSHQVMGTQDFRISRTGPSSRELLKGIKDRNIFNSEGKFPEEKFGEGVKSSGAAFDINAECRPTTLQIQLLGTIFLGDRFNSIATVQDKNYSEADIYRVGDEIYGSDGAKIAAVDRQTLIINNGGVKECIELNTPLPNQGSDGFPSFGTPESGGGQGVGGGASEVSLDSAYVESELGPGFAKIMDAARFVPNTVDGQVNGFKVFAIKGGTIMSRIGLQNNDVVTQVNDTSLKQVDQGFAFYQALQDDKEVRIQYLRGGTTPQSVTVRIK